MLQVIVYDQGQVIESPAFTGRVGFTGIPWSADVVLNDTRVSDSGIYRCVVSNPPEVGDPGIGELSLSVLGKRDPLHHTCLIPELILFNPCCNIMAYLANVMPNHHKYGYNNVFLEVPSLCFFVKMISVHYSKN